MNVKRAPHNGRVQGCARSQVYRVVQLFVEGGRDVLFAQRRQNGRPIVDTVYVAMVRMLVEATPRRFGFDRATWMRELLAIVPEEHTGGAGERSEDEQGAQANRPTSR